MQPGWLVNRSFGEGFAGRTVPIIGKSNAGSSCGIRFRFVYLDRFVWNEMANIYAGRHDMSKPALDAWEVCLRLASARSAESWRRDVG